MSTGQLWLQELLAGNSSCPLPAPGKQPCPCFVPRADLKDFKFDGQHVIEVDEGNTAVIACDLPESHPKAQVRYSVKHEWLEASRGEHQGVCPHVSPHSLNFTFPCQQQHCLPPSCPFLASLRTGSFRV